MHVLYIGGSETDYSLYHTYLDSGTNVSFTLSWCATIAGALSFLRAGTVDVALLDLTQPASGDAHAVEQLHVCCPDLSIVVITNGNNPTVIAPPDRVQDTLTRGEITPSLLRRVLCYAYERKHVQERLRASEERYRLIVEDQVELICRFDPDFRLTFVNRAYSEQYRMQPEAMLGLSVLDMIPEDDYPAARAHISSLSPEYPQAISEHRSLQPDGGVRWVQWQDRAIFDHAGNLLEVQGVGRDITDRRQVEDQLKFLFTLLETTNQAPDYHSALHDTLRLICEHNNWVYGEVWLPDGDCEPRYVCPLYYAAPAYADQLATFRAHTDAMRITPGEGLLGKITQAKSVQLVSDIQALPNGQFLRRKVAIDIGFRSIVAAPIQSEEQQPLAVLLFASTEPIQPDNKVLHLVTTAAQHLETILMRRKAEAAVRRSNLLLEQRVAERTAEMERAKKRAETILNSSRDAIILADGEHRIQQTNAAFERLFRCSPDDYFHVPLCRLVDDESLSLLENALWQLRASAETPRIEVRARRRDGTAFEAEIGITPALLSAGQSDNGSIVCIMRDITERKRADRTLSAVLEEEREFQKYLKELHEVTMELTQVDDFNAFCRRTIELGRARLGFERLALFLYDEKRNLALGTYGTDMQGSIVDERHVEFEPNHPGVMTQSFKRSERFCYAEEIPLATGRQPTGLTGWNAAAVVWNGKQQLGWLVADGALSQTLPSKALLDVLALYSMTVGTLLARKKAEAALRESEERLRLLFDNVPDGIVLSGLDGRFIDVNPAVVKWAGLAREQIIGKAMADLDMFVPVNLSESQTSLEPTANGALGRTEFMLRRDDGSTLSLDVLTHPITVHGSPMILSIAHDITPRKRAEEELRNALQRERELHDLKSRFVSTASHEFRTPLTTIQAAADTLEEFYNRMTEAERGMRFNKIREQVEHMTALVSDVLTIERIEADTQQVDLETIILPEFLSVIIGEFRDMYPEYRLNCDYQARHLTLKADRNLLRQIITNLLSNAAKYSAKGSTVYCGLKQHGGYARLEVRDEGIGIPESDRPHLFDPFFRARNSSGIPGTGLGLAIARRAVEAHGGSLSFESKLGVGTSFFVELPIHPVSL